MKKAPVATVAVAAPKKAPAAAPAHVNGVKAAPKTSLPLAKTTPKAPPKATPAPLKKTPPPTAVTTAKKPTTTTTPPPSSVVINVAPTPAPVAVAETIPMEPEVEEEEEEGFDSIDLLLGMPILEEGDPNDPRFAPPDSPPPPQQEQEEVEEEEEEEEDATQKLLHAISLLKSEKQRASAMAALMGDVERRQQKQQGEKRPERNDKGKEEANDFPPTRPPAPAGRAPLPLPQFQEEDDEDEEEEELKNKRPAKRATGPPSAPVTTTNGKKKIPAQAGDGSGKPYFPHAKDVERIANYVYMTLVSVVTTGHVGADTSSNGKFVVKDWRIDMEQSHVFFARYVEFRKKLVEILASHFAVNPVMMSIIDAMKDCKLDVSSTHKPLYSESNHIYCVWTGNEIDVPGDVRPVGLVPIDCSYSHTGGSKIENGEPLPRGVMFQIHSKYANVLKCIHTVLFFIDYMNAEIQNTVQTSRKTLAPAMFEWTPASENQWRFMAGLEELHDTVAMTPAERKKRQSIVQLTKTLQTSFVGCVECLRKELGPRAESAFLIVN